MKTVLLLTDFNYEAKGRVYYREDVLLSTFLRKFFRVCISPIEDADKLLPHVDGVLLRNTGPQANHSHKLKELRQRSDLCLFNDLKGKGDILGKAHLIQLYQAGYPVIPSFASPQEVPPAKQYLIKPLNGADSNGVKLLQAEEIQNETSQEVVFQPLLEFTYEVSFYFVGKKCHYALYAPDPTKRWELKTYVPNQEDLNFAEQFIAWNTCRHGIQRVDACRLSDGRLLLMELEDYNPFLSLELLESSVQKAFLEALAFSLDEQMQKFN